MTEVHGIPDDAPYWQREVQEIFRRFVPLLPLGDWNLIEVQIDGKIADEEKVMQMCFKRAYRVATVWVPEDMPKRMGVEPGTESYKAQMERAVIHELCHLIVADLWAHQDIALRSVKVTNPILAQVLDDEWEKQEDKVCNALAWLLRPLLTAKQEA